MSNTKNIIKFKKTRRGDLVCELNPSFSRQAIKALVKSFLRLVLFIFVPIFSFFDRLAEKRKLVVSSVGLGIGLGLSIVVTQRPDALQAFPVLENAVIGGAEVALVKIPKLDLYLEVKRDEISSFVENIATDKLVHLQGSGYLGEHKPVVIADLSSRGLLSGFDQMSIGDEIIVEASNKGVYKFRVIETRETEAQYLPHVIAEESNALIIYRSENLLRTRLFIVVAKPVKKS